MHKLMLLFERPEDSVEFERRWSEEFVPQAERMPGLRRISVSRVTGRVEAGESGLYLVHEFHFENRAALEQAMASEAGQQAGRILVSLAGEAVQLLFAEHMEDKPRPTEESEA